MNYIFSKNDTINKSDVKQLIQSGNTVQQYFPLSFYMPLQGGGESKYTFPIEPLISISGKNIIIKRKPAKSTMRGTIKECWSRDDFLINIQGSFVHSDLHTYPADDVNTLKQFCDLKRPIRVTNELLLILDIDYIIIEYYSFPFSKGENVQNFNIQAISDSTFQLFIDTKIQ